MKIALCQINTKVGDLQRNTDLIIKNIDIAKEKKVDLIVFPELAITGYPPKDLLDFDCFVMDNLKCLDKIRAASRAAEALDVMFDIVDAGWTPIPEEIVAIQSNLALLSKALNNAEEIVLEQEKG